MAAIKKLQNLDIQSSFRYYGNMNEENDENSGDYVKYRELAADAWSSRQELKSLLRRVGADEGLTDDERESLIKLLSGRIRYLTDRILDQE